MNWMFALVSFGVGVIVGFIGMGGGVLMILIFVLFFGVFLFLVVSSDLVVSVVMKLVGLVVHFRWGTVRTDFVIWLAIGSVLVAFVGVLVVCALGWGAVV